MMTKLNTDHLNHCIVTLEKKVVIITGAASGIGLDLVKAFLSKGACVCGLDLHALPIQDSNLLGFELDISDESQVNHTIDKIIKAHGQIDVLVNNAGLQIISEITEFEYADWKKLSSVLLDGSFLLTKACMKIMKKMPGLKSIVNIGSIHSFEASKNKSAYIAAKHGLLGLTRAIAMEGADYGIKANLIAPGYVRTPLVEKQIPEQAKQLNLSEEDVIKKMMLGKTVDGEFTTTQEIIDTLFFFVQFPSLALTGQSLLVSHGQNMS